MKIHIVDQAEDDLVEGYNFYEDQAAGLGVYFLDCFYFVCWYTSDRPQELSADVVRKISFRNLLYRFRR